MKQQLVEPTTVSDPIVAHYERFYQEPVTSLVPSPEIVELLRTRKHDLGQVVLDAGCGDGANTVLLAKAGMTVCAVDVSARSIELTARQLEAANAHATLKVASLSKLPFPDHSFDSIICRRVICFASLAELPVWMYELSRVLRPGGSLFINAPSASRLVGVNEQTLEVTPGGGRIVEVMDGLERGITKRYYTQRELLLLAQEHRFSVWFSDETLRPGSDQADQKFDHHLFLRRNQA